MSPFAVSQWFPKRLVPALLAAAALTAVLVLVVLLRDEVVPNRLDNPAGSRGGFSLASRASRLLTPRIHSLRKRSDAPPTNALKRPADLEYQFLAEGDLYRRADVIRALAETGGSATRSYLLELLAKEKDPSVKSLLENLTL